MDASGFVHKALMAPTLYYDLNARDVRPVRFDAVMDRGVPVLRAGTIVQPGDVPQFLWGPGASRHQRQMAKAVRRKAVGKPSYRQRQASARAAKVKRENPNALRPAFYKVGYRGDSA
jgi:hypothetical protein